MPKGNPNKKLALLSPRQKEVLQLLCQGKQYKEIAEALFIEESTVKAHMAGVYEKLGLIELKRDERIFQIKSIYCPLLQEEEKPEIIDVPYEDIVDNSEPEEITPELDEMVSSDEKAIIKYEGENKIMSSRPNQGKGRLSGVKRFFRTILVLIILVVIVGGGLYIWQNFFGGTEVIPQGILQKEYYGVNDWVKQGNIWLRIRDYHIDNIGLIEIDMEIWNKSSNQLLFSYNPGISFKMTDNTGHSYKLAGPYDKSSMDNEIIDAQDVRKIDFKANASTVAFYDKAVFSADVTDLYLTMDEFVVFKNVKFIIPIR
jgi:DNA-binding CsgD family transcriptional regulator